MAISNICDQTFCTGCAACSQVCPKKAIVMRESEEGFLYPVIDDNCIECGLCIKKCPINQEAINQEAINQEAVKHPASFYMGWHRDKDVLVNSSSGGMFTALSRYMFRAGGVVFGAVKDENDCIVHTSACSEEELEPIRLSKYYQSFVGNTYAEVKELLDGKTPVLFTGTACQVAGLKSFLGKEYEHLVTADVLCHGVASKKAVDGFIKSKEKQYKKKLTDYHFRVKESGRGWYNGGGTRMHLFFEDGSSAVEPGKYDTFFLGFNNNFFLRESCYNCQFCGTERVSDFTLADYWKCDHPDIISDEQKKLGVALILSNTEKAEKILSCIDDQMMLYEIDGADAISHNRALVKPQERPEIRDDFYSLIAEKDYDSIIHSQFKERFVKRRIKRILKHFLPESVYGRYFKD